MPTILLISPYWKEDHRWMVSSVKLAELWQRLGYRVVVACMGSTTGKEEVSDTLTIYRKKDLFLPDPLNFGIALGFFSFVRKIIRNEQPNLIICNKVLFWTSFSVIPLRILGHRVLLLTDALVGMTWWPRTLLPKIIMGMGAWTIGWLILFCADHVVTFFPQPPKLLRLLGIALKTQVIATGIDPAAYHGILSSDQSRIRISYVGRLESVKGVDDFLSAVEPLVDSQPFLSVQVVGWYKEGHPLVERYAHKVTFTGLRDDIPHVLSETDIFVLPSYSEGLSNALMEAMASGCACVASEVGGNRYLIQNGVSGFLFPPGDRAALESHLRRLLDDSAKRESMGKAARERMDNLFSWEIIGKQYQKLFEALRQS